MVPDALAPCVARSSAAMMLTLRNEWILIFHKEGFQLPAPSQYREMMYNTNNIFCVAKKNQHDKS